MGRGLVVGLEKLIVATPEFTLLPESEQSGPLKQG